MLDPRSSILLLEVLLEVKVAAIQLLERRGALAHALLENRREMPALLGIEDVDELVEILVDDERVLGKSLGALHVEQPGLGICVLWVQWRQDDLAEPGEPRGLVELADIELLAFSVLGKLVPECTDVGKV